MTFPRIAVVVLLVLSSCWAGRRATSARPDPVLVELDARWVARGQEGLDPVERSLIDAFHDGRDRDPAILWRLARYYLTRGLVEQDSVRSAMDRYAEARSLGMTCLDTSPAFLQRRLELGLHQALPFIDAERMPCAAWATLAWARWITLFGGEAAAVDLEEVSRLADHVAAHGDASAQSLALWAQALVELSRPSWVDGEPGKGRTLLERAIQLDRAQLARHEDLLVRVAVPTRDRALFEDRQAKILAVQATTPEDEAVQVRVRRLQPP